jgi:hypothetical protein
MLNFASIMKNVLNTKPKKEEHIEEVVHEPTALELFLDKYDSNKNLKFDKCRFRPNAPFTTKFGFDNTFKTLRLHPAIDRGYSPTSIYDIYAPFDIENASFIHPYSSFGSLLLLPVKGADFEIRIAHIIPEELSSYFKSNLLRGEKVEIPSGNKIGEAGNLGLSSGTEIVKGKAGAHTHTEIVSLQETSGILDSILEKKVPSHLLNIPYDNADIIIYSKKTNSDTVDFLNQYNAEIKKRNITFINDYKCVRTDYHTGKIRTFYNSQAIFEM